MDVSTLEADPQSIIFRHMLPEHFLVLKQEMRTRRLKAGKHLFHEGDPAKEFYLLKTGQINLYRLSPEGDEKVFQQIGSGESIAEAAMFMSPAAYPVSCRAEQDCELISFSRGSLLTLTEQHPNYAMQLLQALSTRLHQALNRVDQLTLKNAGQRLASYLLELRQAQKTDWLTLPVPHSVLAGQLNIAPETLSRIFQKLRHAEAIAGKRQTVTLLDIEKMCDLVKLPYFTAQADSAQEISMSGCCNLPKKWF